MKILKGTLEESNNLKDMDQIEKEISIIQEVDESNWTTDEKLKPKSPDWGKRQKAKKQEELDQIPFEIEDRNFHSSSFRPKLVSKGKSFS